MSCTHPATQSILKMFPWVLDMFHTDKYNENDNIVKIANPGAALSPRLLLLRGLLRLATYQDAAKEPRHENDT